MEGLPRQSAFMPTIKCSNCGNQVEISMMGEHLCSGAESASEPPPPMPDLLGGAFSSLKQNVFDKFARAPPAVDTLAANKAPTKPDQLTPVSASTGSQAISPKTPTNGRPSTGAQGDDYFAPVIAGSPRRPGGYGGFSAEPESYEPDAPYGASPPKQAPSLLKRMDTITPGPFEMKRPGAKNAFSRSSSRDDAQNSNDDLLQLGTSLERPSTAASGSSATSGGASLPRVPRKNGYGGFGPPQREGEDFEMRPAGLSKRSDTFPNTTLRSTNDDLDSDGPSRMLSAPGLRPDRLRRPSNNQGDRPSMTRERSSRPSFGTRDTSRPPPPRTSLMRASTRNASNLSVNLADEFGVGNPYHSPSVSQSSSNSGFSGETQPSQPSSNTSPARSTKSRAGPRRQLSDTTGFDALMNDLQTSMNAMSPIPPSPVVPEPTPAAKGYSVRTSSRRAPPEGLRVDPSIPVTQGLRLGSPIKSPRTPGLYGDRLDPAVQGGQTRSRDPGSHNRQPSRGARPRGDCKACRKPITGKSVSSADGRLTGRYHKACFVCTTCQEPFSSSTFYVLNDQPYCEQHYHKLNGSLCASCNRGIEGQYLEDEVPQKYHPGCFRCGDCGTVLRDGYFDVDGQSYCERDAWKRIQSAVRAQQQQQQVQAQEPPARQQPPRGAQQQPTARTNSRAPQPAPSVRDRSRGRGLPSGPDAKAGSLNRPFGLPTGNRLMPGQALGRGGLSPIPKMEKRMTRLGMM
ncbi:hypothetical protein GGR56DRAFT_140106 [Xylariaceae sp. FL0804]|nr:hypothetical protein GGR56DRAFT_140106 [Xylariaceae sp. FL0804]